MGVPEKWFNGFAERSLARFARVYMFSYFASMKSALVHAWRLTGMNVIVLVWARTTDQASKGGGSRCRKRSLFARPSLS